MAQAAATRQAAARADSIAREAVKMAEEKSGHLHATAASRRLPVAADSLQHAEGLVHSYEQHAADLVSATRSLVERSARAGRAGAAGIPDRATTRRAAHRA